MPEVPEFPDTDDDDDDDVSIRLDDVMKQQKLMAVTQAELSCMEMSIKLRG